MKSINTVRNEIHYAQVGEYQLPLLILSQTDDADPLGKYGRMRLAYLKTQRPVLYHQMLLNGTLWPHLQDVQKTACKWLERTMTTLLDQVPRAGQRARTASLGGAHEWAESAGRGGGGEGSRVCRMISDSIRMVSKADIFDFILDFCGIFSNFKIKI
jgi:hypothetical protein